MDKLKFVVIACGIAGLVACFLPAYDGSSSAFELRDVDRTVYMLIGAFALATLSGVLGVVQGVERWQPLIACICFLFAIFKVRDSFFHLFERGNEIGKTMVVAMSLGLLSAIGLTLAAPNARER